MTRAQAVYDPNDGSVWFEAMSDSPVSGQPAVVVPVSVIEKLTDSELREWLNHGADIARELNAINTAEWVINSNGRVDAGVARSLIESMEQWRDSFHTIDTAIRLCEAAIIKAEHKDKTKLRRSSISKDYHKIFMQIGRRDGFACAHCGASDNDLEIDHIMPLSKGGTNHLDNLQLLCRSCNSRKSDKVDI